MSSALAELKFMQARGAKALAETCTQYLVLSIEDQMPGKSWDEAGFVFTPPLREKGTRSRCGMRWQMDTLSVVSTDHCPFTMEQKALGKGDFGRFRTAGRGWRTGCSCFGTLA